MPDTSIASTLKKSPLDINESDSPPTTEGQPSNPPPPKTDSGGGVAAPSTPPPDDRPKQRGGFRPGAGRKPTPKVSPPNDDPPRPFASPAGPSTSAAPGAAAATVQDVLADPGGLADILIVALDGAAYAVGQWRYGKDSPPLIAAAEGKREIRKAAVAYMTAMGTHMTPGQALMAAIAAAYVPTVVARELNGDAKRKRAA